MREDLEVLLVPFVSYLDEYRARTLHVHGAPKLLMAEVGDNTLTDGIHTLLELEYYGG